MPLGQILWANGSRVESQPHRIPRLFVTTTQNPRACAVLAALRQTPFDGGRVRINTDAPTEKPEYGSERFPFSGEQPLFLVVKEPVFVYQGDPQDKAARQKQFAQHCAAISGKVRNFMLEQEIPPGRVVVLWDEEGTGRQAKKSGTRPGKKAGKRLRYATRSRPNSGMPAWSPGAPWGVAIGESMMTDDPESPVIQSAVSQIASDFGRNFTGRVTGTMTPPKGANPGPGFPWGSARLGEMVPLEVVVPDSVWERVHALNGGPNFAANIANSAVAHELPNGTHISHLRITHDALKCREDPLARAMSAFREFECACRRLVGSHPEIQETIMGGVEIDPRLRDVYLFPRQDSFSVRRLDLHLTDEGGSASESDEMPGGVVNAFFYDECYGVNQDRWQAVWQWLFANGPVAFVVSDEWSQPYLEDFRWLVSRLRELGHSAHLVTTSELERVTITEDSVELDGVRLGRIWRQFPIFEAKGKLADLVLAAHGGLVDMVPEFAFYGNKVLYHLYWQHRGLFVGELSAETVQVLDEVMPVSALVSGPASFPFDLDFALGYLEVDSLEALKALPKKDRDELVLKVVGAGRLASRSHGVLIGSGISDADWAGWFDAREEDRLPYIVQRRFYPSVTKLPVFHLASLTGEEFQSKVLLRPWMIGGTLVSVNVCGAPKDVHKVHGMVSMVETSAQIV